jgi:hypothetical protein
MNQETVSPAQDARAWFGNHPAFCTFDSESATWLFGNERIQRTLIFKDGGFFSTSCIDQGLEREYQYAPASEGCILIGDGQGEEIAIDLGRDFRPANPAYTFSDRLEIKGGGVKGLTIHAEGTGRNSGLCVDICYDLYPGREPWLSKWFRLHASGPWLTRLNHPLRGIRFDSIPLPQPATLQPVGVCHRDPSVRYANASICRGEGVGLLATVEGSPLICLDEDSQCLEVACGPSGVTDMETWLAARQRATGKAVLVCFDRDPRQALWHYQLFLIHRWLKANCRTMPPWYKTWFRHWEDTEWWLRHSQEAEALAVVNAVKACGFAGLHYVIGVRAGHGARDYEQGFIHGEDKTEECRRLMPHGFDKEVPGSLPAACREADLEFGMHLFWPGGSGGWCGDLQAARDSTPALIRFFKSCDARFCWYEDTQAGVGNLMTQTGWTLIADAVRAAIPGFRFARTWIKEVEQHNTAELACPFDAIRQRMLNIKGEAEIDDYYSVSREWREWAVRHWFRPSFIEITMAAVDVLVKDGRGTLEDLDFFLSSQAFLSCMHLGGMIEKLTPEERAIVSKWVAWNGEHRDMLQYAQPLDMKATLESTTGIMHLAPEREGRLGFIGIWNDDPAAADCVSLTVDFALYGLPLPRKPFLISDAHSGERLNHEWQNGRLVIPSLNIPPRRYRLLDFREQFA